MLIDLFFKIIGNYITLRFYTTNIFYSVKRSKKICDYEVMLYTRECCTESGSAPISEARPIINIFTQGLERDNYVFFCIF